ncbi:AAA family ATPase, partial [Candidatus Sumerlaeota bacterium]|nr:AAA family ATPase [Candidatus Sumerlaeota bacterium]
MSDNDNAQKEERCFFKGVLGLDRILKQQSFPATQRDHNLYSLPYPQKGKTGSCNIVILGDPGTGKSTLALEMALGLRVGKLIENNVIDGKPATVIYYSLEQDRDSLIKRMDEIQRPDKQPADKSKERAIYLEGPKNPFKKEDLLVSDNEKKEKADKKTKGQTTLDNLNLILMPILSPRPLEQILPTGDEGRQESGIFWKRLGEIRNLIDNLERIRKNPGNHLPPPLRMVIIDSLNVFGDKTLSRYLIDQMFSFFSDRGLIGAFIAEDFDSSRIEFDEKSILSPGIVNLADVVIRMSWDKEEGYFFRNIEIVKSRQTPNVYGQQQMKIRNKGIEIFPSLHSWYNYLHSSSKEKNNEQENTNRINKFFDSFEIKKPHGAGAKTKKNDKIYQYFK